ncbi:hypothetical protein JZ751_009719 [Albula glossodonta]|uniref:Non-syndromic hearing impairment protein 5 n=1 Tax=Albula glossodonta TaxID=121402 RepID=A0A8T2P0B3_9TELE|nr:hypothetical protein JZ751_009719 [Albula glossodonta]
MFAKATSNFLKQIDPDGSLIPVSRLNDSDKLVPLSLVIKRKRFWVWQRPKYVPSDFTLSDVLLGDKPINPVVVETDFLKYAETVGDSISGKVDGAVGQINISVEGKGSSKLQSSFGSLRKQEVDHCLIEQTREKHNEVFGILKEKIVTTQQCSVTEEVQEQGACAAALGFLGNKRIKVSVNENGDLHQDSNVSLEIPPQTPDTRGGFEVDSPLMDVAKVDGLFTKELGRLQAHFQQLADLPVATRSTLLQHLRAIMSDRAALCLGEKPDLSDLEDLPSLKQAVQALLELLLQVGQTHQNQTDGLSAGPHHSSPVLTAAHLLVSAMAELTDAALTQLRSCSPPVLQALQQLVYCLAAGGEASPQEPALSPLAGAEGDGYKMVEQLFSCCDVALRREASTLRANCKISSLLAC